MPRIPSAPPPACNSSLRSSGSFASCAGVIESSDALMSGSAVLSGRSALLSRLSCGGSGGMAGTTTASRFAISDHSFPVPAQLSRLDVLCRAGGRYCRRTRCEAFGDELPCAFGKASEGDALENLDEGLIVVGGIQRRVPNHPEIEPPRVEQLHLALGEEVPDDFRGAFPQFVRGGVEFGRFARHFEDLVVVGRAFGRLTVQMPDHVHVAGFEEPVDLRV